ncbi:MAG: hypothetical protein HDQ96_00080, partial [Lachnospiraceae bacterium]|nr:hypothetical protein [Lachnospiraceae bacterium]
VGLIKGQYEIFINALLLQHSIVKLSSIDKTKLINNILTFFWENHDFIKDSAITYLLLIIIKSVPIEDKLLESLFDVDVGKEVLRSKSNQISILFADLYNENCRLKFEAELNEFFVSNDITIYYNMLAQLLFNSHGTIHDSKLDAIYKKLIENVDDITEQDITDISNIIPNCISLLKLTKSYDQSIKKEEELEQNFFIYSKNLKDNLHNVRDLIEGLTESAKERFEIINKDCVEEGIRKYYNKIIDVLNRKKYNIKEEEISNLVIFIGDDCEINNEGHLNRNINLYKDTIIFEELAYLLHNAHSHSSKVFSLNGNADKKYLVWIKAELHNNHILLRLFNSIEKKENSFRNAVKAIQDKKRIGKTYLEKFNIHVLYFEDPKGIADKEANIGIFETRIEIPYFN